MKKIITYWTFDVIHEWHINILRKSKALWDYLIVWISSDKFNELKWKKSYQNFNERKKNLEQIKYVDEVIAENNWEQKKEDIKKYNIDIFTMWSDWYWKFDELKELCEVVYLPRTKWISSTKIRKNIFSMFLEKININIKENTHMFKKKSIKFKSLLLIPIFYIFSYIIKKEKWLYIFWSMNWQNISWNSKAMFEYYENNQKIKRYYMTRNKDLVNNNIIYINSFKAINLILKAEYIFTDSSASSVSTSLALLWKFNIVRLWHWDTIKKINFDSKKYISSIRKIWRFLLRNEYKNNIVIPVWSEANKEIMNSAFLWNKAIITWLPRNDLFFENKKNKIKQKIKENINLNKYNKIFLYTPTWRDTWSIISPFSKNLLKNLNNYLKENNYIFLISWHIQTEEISFKEMSNIKNIKNNSNFEIQELLVIADILITDYSSIYIDFLLTNKPIIFYAYDLEKYITKDREFYFDYNKVIINESLTKNEYDFFDTIKNINNIIKRENYIKEYKNIKNFFHKYQNWWYCKKLDLLLNKK